VTRTDTKKHIITIAGRPGSGKSTVAKEIAKTLKFKHFSSGDLFRKLGADRGVNVTQANITPGVTEEIDGLVDGKLRSIGNKQDRIVIDSRIAWHWIPSSFKVFLELDLEIAAQRILDDLPYKRLATENVSNDRDEYVKQLKHRLELETKRYKTVYGIDSNDMKNYDLIVDSLSLNAKEVERKIIQEYNIWLID